ncbi:altered inheritance of mitochondria protein 31, mitochondrial [Aspergillus ellipticus CBS 707.79]|uniref:Altered inheritance of mitochondria protein 31, mitochondrial n=1 Tax=Aspergillus ellipticus CBS 707.79 TaxID=1448320 RepID=A0A319D598_9EURO|nr:altered inheritance of mitochondria protein 31, mitochondrial [Aspergillus ellipticus CBS 707.79]
MTEPLPSSFEDHPEFQEETSLQKFRRRLKEEPLIPLGCAATTYALYRAYRSMKAGDSVELNRMFRARIYAQFFTLVAVVCGGMYYKTERQQRKDFEQAVEARKSQEKRDAWLRELEIRDQEDKNWRERHAAIEAAAKEATEKSKMPASEQDAAEKSKKPVAEQDAARSAIEPSEEKSIGVLSAVKELLSRQK